MIMVYELGLQHDCWSDFLNRNGFEDSSPPQVDKPMVTESKPIPVPYSVLLPKPLPDSPVNLPMYVTKQVEVAKPAAKKPKAKIGANSKGKKNARLISHMARNKPKTPANPEPIVVSEDSDSEIERFLANEYPYSEGLCDKPLMTLSKTYHLVCGMIPIFLALKCLVEPSVTRRNPHLLNHLFHHAISVVYGWRDTT
jgi:hypothetical protein